jgi:hypothetical protein
MNPIYKQLIRSSVLGTLALGALVFIPAGTLNYWQGLAYFGTSIFASALYTIYLVKYEPTTVTVTRRCDAGLATPPWPGGPHQAAGKLSVRAGLRSECGHVN